MLKYYLIVMIITLLFSAFFSYKWLDETDKYFQFFLLADVFANATFMLVITIITGSIHPLFFICSTLSGVFLALIIMSIKNILWHTRIIYEEEEQARLEAIKNNPYYQQAHDEVNDLVEGRKDPKINLNK